MARSKRILHPSDFSKASRPALLEALKRARQDGAEVLIVHVLTPPVPLFGDVYVSPETYEALDRAARQAARTGLDRLVARAKQAKVRATGLLLHGLPHEQIPRVARTKRVGLIVMGTHGRTGLPRLFLGSVAGRVVASAPCPVLTVRGR